MVPPILILGLGNVLLSDDGLGVHIINKLLKDEKFMRDNDIEILEGGTLGLTLIDRIVGRELVIVIDAVKGDQLPGTVYCFKFHDIKSYYRDKAMSLHQLDFISALELGEFMGRKFPEILIIGIQPGSLELSMTLSGCVAEKLSTVIDTIHTSILDHRTVV